MPTSAEALSYASAGSGCSSSPQFPGWLPSEAAEAPGTRRESGKPELAPAASRDEQMAEIRRMLNQLQSPGAADEEAGEAFARERDVAGIERMAPAREEYRDPLREKLLDPAPAGGAPRWKEQGNYDRDGLMRKHRKRNRRRQVAEKTRP